MNRSKSRVIFIYNHTEQPNNISEQHQNLWINYSEIMNRVKNDKHIDPKQEEHQSSNGIKNVYIQIIDRLENKQEPKPKNHYQSSNYSHKHFSEKQIQTDNIDYYSSFQANNALQNINKSIFEQQVSRKIADRQNDRSNNKLDTKLDIKLDTRLDTKLDTRLDTKLDSRLDTKLDSRLDTKLDNSRQLDNGVGLHASNQKMMSQKKMEKIQKNFQYSYNKMYNHRLNNIHKQTNNSLYKDRVLRNSNKSCNQEIRSPKYQQFIDGVNQLNVLSSYQDRHKVKQQWKQFLKK